MTKEEIKQYLRNQIDFSIKIQDEGFTPIYHLYYNKSYLRALKLSTITGQPVNKDDFKCGDKIFGINDDIKAIWYHTIIQNYLEENYSKLVVDRKIIVKDVLNEYDEYKNYFVF